MPRHRDVLYGEYTLTEGGETCINARIYQVQPAAGFAHEVKARGGKVAIFNVEYTPDPEFDFKPDFLFLGPCEETLPKVLFDVN